MVFQSIHEIHPFQCLQCPSVSMKLARRGFIYFFCAGSFLLGWLGFQPRLAVFWRPCDAQSQRGKSKSIQNCAIAPRTPRMDSDSPPSRLIKFRIRIGKVTTGECLEIKDMLMRLFQYTTRDPFPILISTNIFIFISYFYKYENNQSYL